MRHNSFVFLLASCVEYIIQNEYNQSLIIKAVIKNKYNREPIKDSTCFIDNTGRVWRGFWGFLL